MKVCESLCGLRDQIPHGWLPTNGTYALGLPSRQCRPSPPSTRGNRCRGHFRVLKNGHDERGPVNCQQLIIFMKYFKGPFGLNTTKLSSSAYVGGPPKLCLHCMLILTVSRKVIITNLMLVMVHHARFIVKRLRFPWERGNLHLMDRAGAAPTGRRHAAEVDCCKLSLEIL